MRRKSTIVKCKKKLSYNKHFTFYFDLHLVYQIQSLVRYEFEKDFLTNIENHKILMIIERFLSDEVINLIHDLPRVYSKG